MKSNMHYTTGIPTINANKCGYTEKEILARKAGKIGEPTAIHCLNHKAHKNGDRKPSAYYYPRTGFYACHICDLRGFANDVDTPDFKKRTAKWTYAPGQTVCRKDTKNSKRIWQEIAPDKEGELWPMFGLGALNQYVKCVYVLEGEPCAEALTTSTVLHAAGPVAGANIVCITSKGGCKQAKNTDWKPLIEHLAKYPDCSLTYIPDCDDGGAGYIRDVDAILGRPKRAQIIDLSPYSRGEKGYDIKNYLEKGLRFAELKAEPYKRPIEAPTGEPEAPAGEPVAKHTFLSPMPTEALDWEFLWDVWLPRGELSILGGRAGTGKGVLLAAIAASALGYGKWPDGKKSRRGGHVVWCGDEDDIPRTLVPRLQAAGIKDMSRIMHYNPHPNLPDMHPAEVLFTLSPPKDTRLVVVDPLISGMKGNSNSATDSRAHLEPWARLAREWDAAVIGIVHIPKYIKVKVKEGSIEDLFAGSHQFAAVARSGWLYLKDELEPTGPRLLYHAKTNCDIPNPCKAYRVHAIAENKTIHIDRFEPEQDGYMSALGMVEGKEDKRNDTQQTILDYLAGEPEQKAKQAEVTAYVKVTVDVSDVAVRKAINVLLQDKAISRTGEGKPNDPYILQLEFG